MAQVRVDLFDVCLHGLRGGQQQIAGVASVLQCLSQQLDVIRAFGVCFFFLSFSSPLLSSSLLLSLSLSLSLFSLSLSSKISHA